MRAGLVVRGGELNLGNQPSSLCLDSSTGDPASWPCGPHASPPFTCTPCHSHGRTMEPASDAIDLKAAVSACFLDR